MKAILTRYHGATNFKGSRVSATADGWGRVYVSYDHALNSDGVHEKAARALLRRVEDRGGYVSAQANLIGGGLPNGDMAWVFVG